MEAWKKEQQEIQERIARENELRRRMEEQRREVERRRAEREAILEMERQQQQEEQRREVERRRAERQAVRERERKRQQEPLDAAMANRTKLDEANGYKRTTFKDFKLDEQQLITANAKVSILGYYAKRGKVETAFPNESTTLAYIFGSSSDESGIGLISENAYRAFRAYLLDCAAHRGLCPVVLLGRASMCTRTTIIGMSTIPCLIVEDGWSPKMIERELNQPTPEPSQKSEQATVGESKTPTVVTEPNSATVQTDIGEVTYTLTPRMRCPWDFSRFIEASALRLRDGDKEVHSYSRCKPDGECERGYFLDERLDEGGRILERTRNGEVIGHEMCLRSPELDVCIDFDTHQTVIIQRQSNPAVPPVLREPSKAKCDAPTDYDQPMLRDMSPAERARSKLADQIGLERVRRMREEAAR